MIEVTFGARKAVLRTSGWWCDDKAFEKALNLSFSKASYPDSPADGIVGASQARAAASRLGGTIKWPRGTTAPEGTVY